MQMHSHAEGTSLPEKIHSIADASMDGKGNRCLITLTYTGMCRIDMTGLPRTICPCFR